MQHVQNTRNIQIKHLKYLKHKLATCATQMSPCCLDEVPEQRGHTDEGEHRDGQEVSHAEVEVPVREVRVDERPEEVVIVIPAEDV